MERGVEVTMMQVEEGTSHQEANEPSSEGTLDGSLHSPEGYEQDEDRKRDGDITETGEHNKPRDGNHTVEDGKENHDGIDKQVEHGKPCDGNHTVEDGKEGHDGNGKPFEHGKPHDGNHTVEDGHDGNDKPCEHDKPEDSESGHAGQHGHRNAGEDGHG